MTNPTGTPSATIARIHGWPSGSGRGVDEGPGDPGDERSWAGCDPQREHGILDVGGDLAKRDVGHPLRTPLEAAPRRGECSRASLWLNVQQPFPRSRMTRHRRARRPPGRPSSTSATAPRRSPTTRRGPAELGAWSERPAAAERDPHRVGALGARPDRGVGDHRRRAAALRLLGLPAALLRGHLRRPRRSRAGPVGGRAAVRRRRDPAPGPDPRARPRRLRAAEGDVPRGRRAGAAAVDADPGPAGGCSPSASGSRPLRDEGVLIVGSGFTTHNLAWFNPSARSGCRAARPRRPSSTTGPPRPSARGDVDAVLDFLAKAPAAREAHPRTEHWAPLYVALGAALGLRRGRRRAASSTASGSA